MVTDKWELRRPEEWKTVVLTSERGLADATQNPLVQNDDDRQDRGKEMNFNRNVDVRYALCRKAI